uniref:hypothetical protein orf350 n=1 Tax=Symphyocladia marchantioides TaxID=88360 RepID=UPI0022FDA03B|nr:hypothetical protein orf350 [Symphyocladia marchantioides]WAX03852.1 hypothetical protein orf350 [Symphyocladia marchantioides]
MITRQIYIAMKKYDLTYVYQLQQYIINCNEIKIILINKVFCDLMLFNHNYSNMKYLIKQINKLDLLNSLVIKKSRSHEVNNIIAEYIKQGLIYKSIKPTWTAKISKRLINLINNTQLKNNANAYYKANNKHFLTKIIIKKLSSYNYINKSISLWLYKNIYSNLSKIHNLKYKKYVIESNNNGLKSTIKTSRCLYFLINKVILNDTYWYIFNYIKKTNNIWKVTNNIEKVILHNTNKLIKIFSMIFKSLLYRKTHQGFIKINIFDNSMLSKTKFLYKYYYSYIISFISFNLIESCNKLMNCFNYALLKKQINHNLNKFEYFYSLKLINQTLNQHVYFCNVKYFCQYNGSTK